MDEEMRKVDINRANVDELTQIPGIGENLARRIIEYRETVHPFEEVIELTAVPGISERMVRQFADRVTVEPAAVVERRVAPPGAALEPRTKPAAAPTAGEEEYFEFVTDEDEEPETAVPQPAAPRPEVSPDEAETAKLPPLYESIRVEPAPEPGPAAPQPTPRPSQGRVLIPVLLGSILGAFVGVLLTLAILAALNNGTLSFARADARLQSEIQDAQRAQNELQQTVGDMNVEFSDNLGYVATRTGDLFLQQQTTDASLQEMNTALEQTAANVAALEEVTEVLDERLTTVAAAAETFDAFLDGLRGLLIDLDNGTGTATPEATPTTIPGAGETATAVPDSTLTSPPTRTPRPTATPIPLPTSTLGSTGPEPTPTPVPTSTPGQQP